jgi:hypothetical protein
MNIKTAPAAMIQLAVFEDMILILNKRRTAEAQTPGHG